MGCTFYRYLLAARNRLNRLRLRTCRSREHIAMFHDIKADGEQRSTDYDCYLSDLEDYVQHCVRQKIRFITPDELIDSAAWQNNGPVAMLTFDDGFESVYTLALPLLRERNIPFTVYVTTGFLDQPGYLSVQQLQALAAEPLCTIGMHAHDHKMFRYETTAFLKADFDRCQKILTDITGLRPTHYAFPYGSILAVSERNIRCVRALGVNSIALTDQRMLTKRDVCRPYKLPRLDLPGYYSGRIRQEHRGVEVGNND